MPDLTPDYSKRDCSLPPGCKDLLDVLGLKQGTQSRKVIALGEQTTVRHLAFLLGCQPFKVIATLIKAKVFVANADKVLPFEQAAWVACEHGFDVSRVN